MKITNPFIIVSFFLVWFTILRMSFQIRDLERDLRRVVSAITSEKTLNRSERHVRDVQIKKWMSDTNRENKRLREHVQAAQNAFYGNNCQCLENIEENEAR